MKKWMLMLFVLSLFAAIPVAAQDYYRGVKVLHEPGEGFTVYYQPGTDWSKILITNS